MITISPGHWDIGTGASGIIDEVTEARKVSKRIVEILTAKNVTANYVEDTMSKNKTQNLSYLVKQHNLTNRQLDVSIHFNSSGKTENRGIGTEVLYYSEKELAAKISKAISTVSGLIDRGPKERKELAILANTNRPAILLEICFVNSSVDVALYRRDFEKICNAVADELIKHIGKPSNTNEPTNEAELRLLTNPGRNELRQLLKSARDKKVINDTHTNEKIENYTDVQLLSYFAAVINRTFK